MKHLKRFENIIKYKVGDYVLIHGKEFQSGRDTPAKIVREFEWGDDFEHMYDNGGISVSEPEYFKRYLTPEEIEDFETKINKKKYNI